MDGSTLYVCVSMLWMAVRYMCVFVCCLKRRKKERGKENAMVGEDNDKQEEGRGRRKRRRREVELEVDN